MTDKNAIDNLKTEKELRDLVLDMQESLDEETISDAGFGFDAATKTWKERIEALLPAPPSPRTLADMSPKERAECQWMQADVLEDDLSHAGSGVITFICEKGVMPWVSVMGKDGGRYDQLAFKHVVPLPGLPRMEWPETTEKEHGEVPCLLDKDGDHWVNVGGPWHMVDPDFAYDNLPERYGPYRALSQEGH